MVGAEGEVGAEGGEDCLVDVVVEGEELYVEGGGGALVEVVEPVDVDVVGLADEELVAELLVEVVL